LLLSGACVIVLTMKASPTAVFPHSGLSPLQLTPMSGAHQSAAGRSRRAGLLTDYENSNNIIAGHVSLRRLCLSWTVGIASCASKRTT